MSDGALNMQSRTHLMYALNMNTAQTGTGGGGGSDIDRIQRRTVGRREISLRNSYEK
jgi:hypothetical protein